MNNTDPIILVAYLICIAFWLNKIKEAFNDEFNITMDEDALKQQLEQQNLQDHLSISFKFDKRYEFAKLKQLAISIGNKSKDYSIYVDWDCSAITDLDGRARRVTRLMPGATLDLFQNQVFSTIAPNTTLKENITAEDLLARKGDRKEDKLDGDSPLKLEIEPSKPLIDLSKPDPKKAPQPVKDRYDRFMEGYEDMKFALELALRLVGSTRSLGGDRVHILCKFSIHKLPWYAGLPWNPKK